MGQNTYIPWCDSTINPTTGCDGCELWHPGKNSGTCFAGNLQVKRLSRAHPGLYSRTFAEVRLAPGRMQQAAGWSDLVCRDRPAKPWLNGQPRVIFIEDMGDLFSRGVPFDYIQNEVIRNVISEKGRRHFWIVVTKQPQRAKQFRDWLLERDGLNLQTVRNLMLMTSVTKQAATCRIDQAVDAGWASVGVSAEPMLGPVDLEGFGWFTDTEATPVRLRAIDWLIVGGPSGSGDGRFDVQWARPLRDGAVAAGVPFFFKQTGLRWSDRDIPGPVPADRHGGDPDAWPGDLRIRQAPDFLAFMNGGSL